MRKSCPICNNKKFEILYKQKFYKTSICLLEEYNIVSCYECGFIFAIGDFSQEKANQYYANLSRWENNVNIYNNNKYTDHFKEMINFISSFLVNKKSLILDVGCSTGEFLNEFKKYGYIQLMGIDPSINCVLATQHNYNIPAFNKNILDFDFDEKFDIITCNAMLEHVIDLKEVVQKLNLLLKDNGLLFIEVPDANRFHEHVYTPFQQFSVEHIDYFSLRSLCNLMYKNNFYLIGSKFTTHKLNSTEDPSIYALFRKVDLKSSYKKDEISKRYIKMYIEKSLYVENKIKGIIKEKLKDEKEIIIWGCGTFLLRMLNDVVDINKVSYFVDSIERYHGKNIGDREIRSPLQINENFPIFISSYAFQDEIEKEITNKLKLKNRIIKIF